MNFFNQIFILIFASISIVAPIFPSAANEKTPAISAAANAQQISDDDQIANWYVEISQKLELERDTKIPQNIVTRLQEIKATAPELYKKLVNFNNNNRRQTLLHCAVHYQNLVVAKELLLEPSTNIYLKDESKYDAMEYAIAVREINLVKAVATRVDASVYQYSQRAAQLYNGKCFFGKPRQHSVDEKKELHRKEKLIINFLKAKEDPVKPKLKTYENVAAQNKKSHAEQIAEELKKKKEEKQQKEKKRREEENKKKKAKKNNKHSSAAQNSQGDVDENPESKKATENAYAATIVAPIAATTATASGSLTSQSVANTSDPKKLAKPKVKVPIMLNPVASTISSATSLSTSAISSGAKPAAMQTPTSAASASIENATTPASATDIAIAMVVNKQKTAAQSKKTDDTDYIALFELAESEFEEVYNSNSTENIDRLLKDYLRILKGFKNTNYTGNKNRTAHARKLKLHNKLKKLQSDT